VCGGSGNFQLKRLLFGSVEAQKSLSTFIMGADGCIKGCANLWSILEGVIQRLKHREGSAVVVPNCPAHQLSYPLWVNGTKLALDLTHETTMSLFCEISPGTH